MGLKLPRLPAGLAVVDASGRPSASLIRWWSDFADRIETEVGALAAAQTALNAAAIARAAAAAADLAAAGAQGTADGLARLAALQNSFVSADTVITAKDAGASVTIEVGAHVRIYGTGATATVLAAQAAGLAFGAKTYVYYDQASRLGGAVALAATTDFAAAQPSDTHPDRHYVGAVIAPADGAADTAGIPNIPVLPPGFNPGGGW